MREVLSLANASVFQSVSIILRVTFAVDVWYIWCGICTERNMNEFLMKLLSRVYVVNYVEQQVP